MSPTLTTFLFELANFLLLAAVLGWFLFTPVRKALEARRQAEQQRATDLDAKAKELASAQATLQTDREASEHETARLRKERLDAAETEASAILGRAREAAERERARAEQTRIHLERQQVEQLTQTVAAVTRQTVARLLTTLHAGELDAALVRAACQQLEAASAETPGQIVVESASALDESARQALTRAAGAGPIEFRVLSELGGGLRITTPHGLIDASTAGLAAYAERELQAKLPGPAPASTT